MSYSKPRAVAGPNVHILCLPSRALSNARSCSAHHLTVSERDADILDFCSHVARQLGSSSLQNRLDALRIGVGSPRLMAGNTFFGSAYCWPCSNMCSAGSLAASHRLMICTATCSFNYDVHFVAT
jgi:hypothetical protein